MTKEKAQELIQTMKRLLKTGVYELPKLGTMDKLPLQSQQSSKDKFDVYINRKGIIDPKKYTLLLHFCEEDLLRIDVMEQITTIQTEPSFRVRTSICG